MKPTLWHQRPSWHFRPATPAIHKGRGGPRPDKALAAKPRKRTLCPEPPGRPLPHLLLRWRQDATRKQSPPRRGREAARNPRLRRASGPGTGVQVRLGNFHPMLHFSLKTSRRKSSRGAPASSPQADVCATWGVLCPSVSRAVPNASAQQPSSGLVYPRNGFSYFECFPPALGFP